MRSPFLPPLLPSLLPFFYYVHTLRFLWVGNISNFSSLPPLTLPSSLRTRVLVLLLLFPSHSVLGKENSKKKKKKGGRQSLRIRHAEKLSGELTPRETSDDSCTRGNRGGGGGGGSNDKQHAPRHRKRRRRRLQRMRRLGLVDAGGGFWRERWADPAEGAGEPANR